MALQLERAARLADVFVRRARKEQGRALDDTLDARELVGHGDVLEIRQLCRSLWLTGSRRLVRMRHDGRRPLELAKLTALRVAQADVLILLKHDLRRRLPSVFVRRAREEQDRALDDT